MGIINALGGIAKKMGVGRLDPQARYDAAGNGRRLAGWLSPATGPNRASEGAPKIRDRARDAQRNEWTGANGVRVLTTSLIGTGIVCRPNTQDAALKAKLNDLWAEWTQQADADGVLDFYGLQTLATRSWILAGEVFVRIRARRPEDGLSVPIQVQLLEADMVPMLDVDAWPGMETGNRIRSGIEINPIGRRVAYWMYRSHPGDRPEKPAINDLYRVPADAVLHLYEPMRPGQLRGVSDMAPVLTRLRGVMDYDDAVLERQKIANLFTLFITSPQQALSNAIRGQDAAQQTAPAGTIPLQPGSAIDLAPGEDVRFSDPPDAGSNYAEFMRHQHLGVASGQGMPYELLTGDIKDVSDRTLRVVINEFRRHCEQRQWQVIIPQFCQPIRNAWAEAAALSGAIKATEVREARRVTWQPHGWEYIHPVQDAQGKQIEVQAGFRSRASVIAARGDDPEEIDAERAADQAREARMSIQAHA